MVSLNLKLRQSSASPLGHPFSGWQPLVKVIKAKGVSIMYKLQVGSIMPDQSISCGSVNSCKEKGFGEYVKETTTPPGWKCQLNATFGCSLNDKETLTPHSRTAFGPQKTLYTGTAKYTRSENKTIHTEARNSQTWDRHKKNAAGLKYFLVWSQPSPFLNLANV